MIQEDDVIRRAKRLVERYEKMRIVGGGGEWSGSARQGFAFNPKPIGGGGTGGPPQPTGACCPEEGDCFISTQEVCEGGGGTYQGDGTDCDPDPCPPPTPTGACCVGEDCTIETEDDCTGMGGTYQGDDTTCDPNPCAEPPCNGCGFLNPDNGLYYLTASICLTFSNSGTLPPPNNECTATSDPCCVFECDPMTGIITSSCSGSMTISDGTGSETHGWSASGGNPFCHWDGLANSDMPSGGLVCESCHDDPHPCVSCPGAGYLGDLLGLNCDCSCASADYTISIRSVYSNPCIP